MKITFKIITFFVVYFVLAYVYYYFLESMEYPTGPRVTLSILFGFFAEVGWLASKSALNLRTDRQNIDSAQQGLPPKPGRRSAVLGTIKPQKAPLITPFSQKNCIAYEYNMQHIERSNNASTDSTGTSEGYDFEGWASTRAFIQTDTDKIEIVGSMDFTDFPLNKAYNYEHANNYIKNTTFTKSSILNIFSLGSLMNDKDPVTGIERSDLRHSDAQDATDLKLEERFVPVDARIWAIGKYSSGRNGSIKHPRLIKGEYSSISKQLKDNFRSRLITGILMLGTTIGMIYMNPPMLAYIQQISGLISGLTSR